MSIYEKLITVQQKLKAPKNQFNSFGKYNYRSCEDILEGLKPILAEVKAVVLLNDEIVMVGDRYYVKATASFNDAEANGVICTTAYAREDLDKKGMDLAQVTGSVSSYARKYALNGLFCIDDTKDSDHTNTGEKPQNYPQQNKPSSNDNHVPETIQGSKNDSKHLCCDCGNEITATKKKTVEQILADGVKYYKFELCQSCINVRYKAAHPE